MSEHPESKVWIEDCLEIERLSGGLPPLSGSNVRRMEARRCLPQKMRFHFYDVGAVSTMRTRVFWIEIPCQDGWFPLIYCKIPVNVVENPRLGIKLLSQTGIVVGMTPSR